jgi:dienelactone hydrolase
MNIVRVACRHGLVVFMSASIIAPGARAQRLVVPPRTLMDEPLDLRATGMRPGERVRLRATMPDSARRLWIAEATYVANAKGEVYLHRDAAIHGSYTGVDAMGLVTSMQPAVPWPAATYAPPSLDSVPPVLTLFVGGRAADSTIVLRSFLGESARVVPLARGSGLVGTLFRPAETLQTSGVLVLGGSEGGEGSRDVAAQLSAHGFTTLSLAYFGVDPLPRELDRIPLEYFVRAIDLLAAQPGVRGRGVAIVGTSKGAEAALLVAARDERVRAVVAYAPSSVAWSCICSASTHSSWSWRREDVPSVPPGRDPSARSGTPLHPVVHYRHRMRDSASVARARIAVERIAGPVMLVAGDDDQLWPSAEMAREVRARLAEVSTRRDDSMLVYPRAGHRIGKSYLPAGSTLVAGGRLETGGDPGANAAAQADAWPRVLRFLDAAFDSSAGGSRSPFRAGVR